MKLQHYLGGLEGLGPVTYEKRVFVEPWEKRIFGIHVAMMALELPIAAAADAEQVQHGVDLGGPAQGRRSAQPVRLLQVPLLREMAGRHLRLFHRKGIHHRSRARRPHSAGPPERVRRRASRAAIRRSIRGSSSIWSKATSPKHDSATKPRLRGRREGLVKNPPSIEHTRLPGHLRNRTGIVDSVYPATYSYLTSTGPDGIGPAMPVYCVRFDPEDLWKGNTEKNETFYADLFEAYLEKRIDARPQPTRAAGPSRSPE